MNQRELAVYVCEHVFEGNRPVLLVVHEGSDWQFLCGSPHEEDAIPRVVGLNHILSADFTIADVLDLPIDWEAERVSTGDVWVRTRIGAFNEAP